MSSYDAHTGSGQPVKTPRELLVESDGGAELFSPDRIDPLKYNRAPWRGLMGRGGQEELNVTRLRQIMLEELHRKKQVN